MRGMGPERAFGGFGRTYGMQRTAAAGFDHDPIKIDKERLKRAARYLLPYWPKWIVLFLYIAITAGLDVLPPLCVRAILDHAIPDKNPHLLYTMVGAIVGLSLSSGLIGVLQSYLNTLIGQSIMFDLRNELYGHLQRQSLGFYTVTRAGEIVSRLNNDVAAVQGVATGTLVAIVSNLFRLIATVTVIFTMDPRLAALAVVIVPAFYLPTKLVGRVRRRLSQETQERQADLVAFMEERLNIGGIMLAKLFGQSGADAQTFEDRNRKVLELTVRQAMAGRWLFMALATISVAGPALIYLYGGHLAIAGRLSIGTIIAFVAYLSNLYRPFAQLANVYVDIQGALAVFERIFDYLDTKPDVEDKPDAGSLDTVAGHIRVEKISFTYPQAPRPQAANGDPDDKPAEPPRPQPALRGVSFEALPGQRVALVGPSGAGKTTLTYLLPRFYDPAEGRITLDGHDLRDLSQESLRSYMGAVTQDTFLFHATLRDNLLYAKPDATEEEIIAAANAANIDDFVQALPEGYDTTVGSRGFRLSGGEKQRVAIARALLKNPKILILDEATSNLDATSEHLIQEALEVLLEGRTSIIIAHRLSTILTADKIVVLNKGRVVESGSHDELLRRGGLYATLYHQQFSRVVEATRAESDEQREKDDGGERGERRRETSHHGDTESTESHGERQ